MHLQGGVTAAICKKHEFGRDAFEVEESYATIIKKFQNELMARDVLPLITNEDIASELNWNA
ncbi:MAG TPA: hypothetical protein V6D19_05000 [Stenomitos sp.]